MALNWDDSRVFLALARTGTLTAAAQQLGIGIATLSRRIERFERALGVALFIRSQTGYELTEEGLTLVAHTEQMEAAMLGFSKQALDTAISGTVRLATAENLATKLILPNLSQLKQQHPELNIEIVTDIRTANLHRHDADIALRMTKPTQGHVSFRRVGTLSYGLYQALEGPTIELTPETAIGWDSHYQDLPVAVWLNQAFEGKAPALTTTSVATQLAACKAGLGIAVLPDLVTIDETVRCVKTLPELCQPIYLVLHNDLRHSKRIRCVADFLTELIEQPLTALNRPT